MRIEPERVDALTIYGADRLDPIFVVLQDLGSGHGRLTIECWGSAWSAYWGAMGSESLRKFVCSCSADYVANRLWPPKQPRRHADYSYLLRIVEAVQQALGPALTQEEKP